MKRTYGKVDWLIASVCFFGLASLGVAFDDSQGNLPGSRQQSSKQEAPPPKVAAAPSAPRKAPAPVAATPAPLSSPAVQPAPQPVAPTSAPPGGKPLPPDMAEAMKKGMYTAQMPPDQLFRELERDKTNYPIQVWCKAAGTCAAKVVPNVNGTMWQARANMSEQGFNEFNNKYIALGYRLADHHSYFDGNGVEFHQAVWLKDR